MSSTWSAEEMSGADFGDARLSNRAVAVLDALGHRPNLSIPAACGGRSEMVAAYRFFDNENVTFDKILDPHIRRTQQRLAERPVALLVQDTTEIDLTRRELEVEGAGTLDGGSRSGFFLHLIQAYTPEGVPLGTVWSSIRNRTEGVCGATTMTRAERQELPIELKESVRWLEGMRRARAVAQMCPSTQVVCIGDSESDIYEVMSEERGEVPVHWVVRTCQDRAQKAEDPSGRPRTRMPLLHERAMSTEVLYTVELNIRARHSELPVDANKSRRQNRQARTATAEVRATTVTLRPPPRPDRVLPPITVNAILVREIDPPEGEIAVEWLLLTTLPIGTLEEIRTVVQYYCVRWQIEVFFRTLKSGCRIEKRRFEHVDRVLACLGICLIVAWRTLFVCRMGRACPEADCETMFEPSEWKAVWSAMKGEVPPEEPPRLREMVHLIARLGGYVGGNSSEPGAQTIWIGLQRMYDLAWAWDTFGPGSK